MESYDTVAEMNDHKIFLNLKKKKFDYIHVLVGAVCSVRNKQENSTCPTGNLKTKATCPPRF